MDSSADSTTATGGDTSPSLDGLSFWKYMAAGSVAGMVEHMAMFPVDTLKTRMQMAGATSPPPLPGHSAAQFSRFFASIVRTEGPLGLYRGIAAMGLGAGPAHAVYFSVYETCKQKLGGNRPGHHLLVHAASGVVATTASDAVLTPMDVVKQRLQLRSSPYGGVRDCVVKMFREEGIRAFYASYKTTIVMNAPFTAVHFSTYEALKKFLSEVSPENASEERILVHLTAGGAAGALASAVTTPLDVVKTRLQCQRRLKTKAKKKNEKEEQKANQQNKKKKRSRIRRRGKKREKFHPTTSNEEGKGGGEKEEEEEKNSPSNKHNQRRRGGGGKLAKQQRRRRNSPNPTQQPTSEEEGKK